MFHYVTLPLSKPNFQVDFLLYVVGLALMHTPVVFLSTMEKMKQETGQKGEIMIQVSCRKCGTKY